MYSNVLHFVQRERKTERLSIFFVHFFFPEFQALRKARKLSVLLFQRSISVGPRLCIKKFKEVICVTILMKLVCLPLGNARVVVGYVVQSENLQDNFKNVHKLSKRTLDISKRHIAIRSAQSHCSVT